MMLGGVSLLLTSCGASGSPTSVPPISMSCPGRWDVSPLPTPPVASASPYIASVAVGSKNDIWAVGWLENVSEGISRALIEHWDGRSWQVVPGPDVDAPIYNLGSVAVAAPGDVWAVGSYVSGPTMQTTIGHPLIAHWNGSAWASVPPPDLGSKESSLAAISAVSATDVWAVGAIQSDEATSVISSFSTHSTLAGSTAQTRQLYALQPAITPTSVPSVLDNPGDPRFRFQPLILHWDGVSWTRASLGISTCPNSQLGAVSAMAADDVWAVGNGCGADPSGREGLILHWDGHTWRRLPSPIQGETPSGSERPAHSYNLLAVTGVPGGAWVVGGWSPASEGEPLDRIPQHALILHWDGTTWSRQPGTLPGDNDFLTHVVATGPNEFWATGCCPAQKGDPSISLVLRGDARTWQEVPGVHLGTGSLPPIAAVGPEDVWVVSGTGAAHYTATCATPATIVSHPPGP
jgi:hypothetical protein